MANKKYKLTDGNYWATDGIHDFGQNKTQREINAALVQADSDLSGAITSETTARQNVDTAIENGLAIIANGNTHYAIESGKYVYIKNHSTLAEGLYKANVTIPTNNPITSTNVTLASNLNGALNDLQNVSGSGYCKMQDGTAFAWGNVSGVTFSSESIKEGTVTLPFSFVSGNIYATPYNTSNVTFMLWVGASLQDSTTLAWTLATLSGSAISVTNRGFSWLAVGRWK